VYWFDNSETWKLPTLTVIVYMYFISLFKPTDLTNRAYRQSELNKIAADTSNERISVSKLNAH